MDFLDLNNVLSFECVYIVYNYIVYESNPFPVIHVNEYFEILYITVAGSNMYTWK